MLYEVITGMLQQQGEFTVYTAEELADSREREISYVVQPDDLALLLLTSGSTGMLV